MRHELAERFRDRLLPIDLIVAARWGTLVGQSESRGQPLPVIDSLIAATSLHHDFTVVTRNTEDLERCGARCFNPWLGASAIDASVGTLALRHLASRRRGELRFGTCDANRVGKLRRRS